MEEDLKTLRLKRGQLKGTVTRIENFINDPVNIASVTTEALQARKEKLICTLKDYEKVQLDILSLDGKDNEDVAILEEKYFSIISKINHYLKNLNTSEVSQCTSVSSSKLPNIDLPVFSGKDFTKYTPFIDLFTAVIHNNKALSDVQKLFYLRKYLSDDALNEIVNLPLVNQSYEEALILLKKRFENKSRLIINHINVLLDLPTMQKGTAASIRSLITEIKQQLYALQNLKQPTKAWDMLLISILSRKLDTFTNRAYQLDRNPEVLPTMEEFTAFLEKRAMALEDCGSHEAISKKSNKVTNVATSNKAKLCTFCKGNNSHKLYNCPSFKTASVDDRQKFVSINNLCSTCLNSHNGKCKFHFTCQVCKEKHNTLLHVGKEIEGKEAVAYSSIALSNNVVLPTVKVKLFNIAGHEVYVRALLDSGSQVSLIKNSLVKALGLAYNKEETHIIGVTNKHNKISHFVNVNLHSPVSKTQLNAKCHVVDSIITKLPQQCIDISQLNLPKNIILSDDKFNLPEEISLLLGADIYFSILLDGNIKIPNGPVLQRTLFGYVLGGTINICNVGNNYVSNLAICDSKKLENVMERFWLTEKVPEPADKLSNEYKKAEATFQSSVKIENNIFQVDMPLVCDLEQLQLGDSFSVAHQRFLTLEKKFKRNHLYLDKYKQFIEEYVALGHAKEVDISEYEVTNGHVYFLAHHAVINEDSRTTKLRVVFDGSMKSKGRVSLNDVMLNGPVVQKELFDILLLFRTYLFTLICDIAKMFRCVRINPKQACLQNILWRDDPCKPISCLQLQTITYGLKASTFLATRCLIELAHRYGKRYPLAAEAMFSNTYVDDVLCGSDSTESLNDLKAQLVELLQLGNFKLHKWSSNVPQVLEDVSIEHKYFDDNIEFDKNNIVKTLGLKYNNIVDQFSFTSPPFKDGMYTKRQVLSFVGKMFDPLGLIGPIIVVAKLFMQQLWSVNLGWDAMLPQSLLDIWHTFLTNLNKMGTVTVPRCVNSCGTLSIELVGYADASQKAFGCCLYLRILKKDGSVIVNLLCSKSRLAPLNKALTIPKLELNAALLLAQLTHRLNNLLLSRFSLKVYLYSDSQIVLAWIKSTNINSNAYVANRVKQIHELTSEVEWSFVKTSDNPADLLSRGVEPQKLQSIRLWWEGPAELSSKDYIHPFYAHCNLPTPPPTVSAATVANPSMVDQSELFNIFKNFSNLNKLQRVIAYMLRFKNNALILNNRLTGVLTPKELQKALLVIIKCTQKKYFPKEIVSILNDKVLKSGISNLHPFLDNENILRVGGRLQNANNIPYEKMHPIILPKACHITRLLIEREHMRLLHAGPKIILSSLSQRYWLVSGHREVKKVLHKCMKCSRLKAAAAKQLMGSLPKERLTSARPFEVVGVDFCGPFSMKSARIRRPLVTKCYVALFVCFAVKAVHIELVSDLTTETFLGCLKRFIARRGMPTQIFSDNAKTFKGASNQLKGLYDLFHSKAHRDSVEHFCATNMIKFNFIPSYSPEFGGLWEAGVKSFKYHFKRIIGSLCLTFEGLYTIITEIEAVMNSRPLLPMSSDISDLSFLTPGHFLIGSSLTSYPELDFSAVPINRLKFWNMCSKIKQDFWKAWSRDYLTLLQNRPKWHQTHPNLNVGDLVIVKQDNVPPLSWPMARIVKIYTGPDGKVRVADCKIGSKIYTRSLRKLCPLPL